MSSGAKVTVCSIVQYRAACDRFGCSFSILFDSEFDAERAARAHNDVHQAKDEREDVANLNPDERARYNEAIRTGASHSDAFDAALS